jgi:hypothetical protein
MVGGIEYPFTHPQLLLILGDLCNLTGGIWLGVDLISKEREMRRHEQYLSVLTRHHGFPIEVDGTIIEKPADVDVIFVRRGARSAKYACALLTLGFALLALGHWIELLRS